MYACPLCGSVPLVEEVLYRNFPNPSDNGLHYRIRHDCHDIGLSYSKKNLRLLYKEWNEHCERLSDSLQLSFF